MLETQVQSLGGKMPWRKEWQLTPVFLSGKFQGQRSLAGYSPWGGKESDMTKHDDRVRKYFVALVAFLNININP